MNKIVGIHQPNFLPWIGYFYKIMKSDIFVFLDDVQFSKGSFTNRNKIKTKNGGKYITFPIVKEGGHKKLIMDCTVSDKENSINKILSSIENSYSKSKYFNDYFYSFKSVLQNDEDNLSNINISVVEWVFDILNIEVETYRSSNLKNIDGVATSRLVSICKEVGADKYLSGLGGCKYQDEKLFKDYGIDLLTSDFIHPNYHQLYGEFIPSLSVLDIIFNCGDKSKDIILKGIR